MSQRYVALCFFGRMLQLCYLDVAYVSHICCMCFIWMLRMVAMVFKCVSGVFKCFRSMFQVFQKHVSSVSTAFRCMLQVLYLDV
jgi:hypothetical protein